MPMPTSALTKDSGKESVRTAISRTISMLIKEGKDDDQAKAIALEDARKHAGTRFIPGKVSVRRGQ